MYGGGGGRIWIKASEKRRKEEKEEGERISDRSFESRSSSSSSSSLSATGDPKILDKKKGLKNDPLPLLLPPEPPRRRSHHNRGGEEITMNASLGMFFASSGKNDFFARPSFPSFVGGRVEEVSFLKFFLGIFQQGFIF